jgi:hypothetical protein
MNPSRRTRFAKRAGLLFVLAIPMMLGAGGDTPSIGEWPPIPATTVPLWQLGCYQLQFGIDSASITDSGTKCLPATFASNADPRCSNSDADPAFFVADGKLYSKLPGSGQKNPIDLKPLLGNDIPNAPNVPVVTVPGSNLVYVFFGHAPQANTTQSPRAFFVAFDAEEFRIGKGVASLRGSYPLDLSAAENIGCGTIHLAAVASDAAHANSATIFISTCSHAYGIRVEKLANAGFSRTPFFYEEITSAKPNTHHRAEMDVAPTDRGYVVAWPYEPSTGGVAISVSSIVVGDTPSETNKSDGSISVLGSALNEKKPLGFLWSGSTPMPFIKGLEIAADWSQFFVTWPGAPSKLFAFSMFDHNMDQFTWSDDPNPKDYLIGFVEHGGIGASQIQTGRDGALYMLTQDQIVRIDAKPSAEVYEINSGTGGFTTASNGWPAEDIRLIPQMTRGATNGCVEIPPYEPGQWSPGPYQICSECTAELTGAYSKECKTQYDACAMDEFGCNLLLRESFDSAAGATLKGACELWVVKKTKGISEASFQLYRDLEACAVCGTCFSLCGNNPDEYCKTLFGDGKVCAP